MNKNGYSFFVGTCLLPIAPEKLQIKINNGNKTVVLMNEGQINIIKSPKLTDIEFECSIPHTKYPFATYAFGFKPVSYYLDHFERLKTLHAHFQFLVSRTLPTGKVLFSTNIKATLEDYKITEQAKDGFDLTVKIKLKQYRAYGTKTVTIKNSSSNAKSKAAVSKKRDTSKTTSVSQTYTVVKGDCLWNIARKFYNDGSKYTVIYNANKKVIGGNPNKIYPGQKLTIPAI